MPTKEDTLREFTKRLQTTRFQNLSEELRCATAPAYLGQRSIAVIDLVNWATTNPRLDPSHRRGRRAWQCAGQTVLSINGTAEGVEVTAGIHYAKGEQKPTPEVVIRGKNLTAAKLEAIKAAVENGMRIRTRGDLFPPDEHWLQAVIRTDPTLVGVEQPALREVPAWRPRGGLDPTKRWGRGYIDLLGVDGSGDIRLVETKLAANSDPMLIFQGLDYYVWSQAYLSQIKERLGAPTRSEVVVHYVIGATEAGSTHVNHFNRAQADALDIPWECQVLRKWQSVPTPNASGGTSVTLPRGSLPKATADPMDFGDSSGL